jgi:hypothetical protein
MSVYKLGAAVAAVALGAAVVTALAGAGQEDAGASPDVRVQPVSARDAPVDARPVEARTVDLRPAEAGCPQEPWPFGCQWREPTRRVSNTPRRSF